MRGVMSFYFSGDETPEYPYVTHFMPYLIFLAQPHGHRSFTLIVMEYAHDAEDWVYGAEGNQTLVLRYKGNDRAYQGHVLRLSKQEQRSLTSPVDVQTQHPQFCVDFIHHVIGPLIGPEYIVPQSIIHVSRPFLQAVSEKIEHERPKSRRGRGIDVDQGWAFVARDLTYGCSIAVEIKPKWGFLPSSSLIDPQHQTVKQSICRFCMHSLLKHNRTDFTYCPLDLFSGDPERMEMAIIALEHESAIHGVFKIFHGNQNISQQLRVAVIKQVLLQEPLLARLQSLQRRLDMLDIEGIYPIYIKHQSEGTLPPIDTIQPWVEAVNAIETRTCKSDWQRLYEFALSMVFKDCSVFISIIDLQGQRDSRYVSDNSYPRMVKIKGHGGNEKVFGYDIKLVDVDMKKMFKIPLWYDRDQAIVTHAIRMGHPKTCEQVILSSD